VIQSFSTKVKSALKLLPQPDAQTCQSACIAMAIGTNDITGIRSKLTRLGSAGDPAVMGSILKQSLSDRYEFDDNACLSEMRDWLRAGEFLIIHTWLTESGHVIGLDGVDIDTQRLSYRLNAKDPWSEFQAATWTYDPNQTSYDGFYSSYLIYATAVTGQSCSDARQIYRRGELDSMRKGAWVHRVKPAMEGMA
jgi:hypothetical protein